MADFNSAWLLGKKQFQSLTGISPDQFRKMVVLLRSHWQFRVVGVKNRDGRPYGVGGLEDHLLVLLIVYRCHIHAGFSGLPVPGGQGDDLPQFKADRRAGAACIGCQKAD